MFIIDAPGISALVLSGIVILPELEAICPKGKLLAIWKLKSELTNQ